MANNPAIGQWPGGKPPQEVHDFVEWLCLPLDMRDPPSKRAYAEKIGRTIDTLRSWEKDDRVRPLIQAKADALNMSPERVQAVLNALYNRAATGDTTAAKLYLEHCERILPRKPPEPVGLETLSDEELQAQLRAHLG